MNILGMARYAEMCEREEEREQAEERKLQQYRVLKAAVEELVSQPLDREDFKFGTREFLWRSATETAITLIILDGGVEFAMPFPWNGGGERTLMVWCYQGDGEIAGSWYWMKVRRLSQLADPTLFVDPNKEDAA